MTIKRRKRETRPRVASFRICALCEAIMSAERRPFDVRVTAGGQASGFWLCDGCGDSVRGGAAIGDMPIAQYLATILARRLSFMCAPGEATGRG